MSSASARIAGSWMRPGESPLASLVFVTPLIMVYELGVLALGPEAVRNGCDVWLRQFLRWIGFGQYFLLPLVAAALLLGRHHLTRQDWVVRPDALVRMAWESLLFASLLLLVSQLHAWCCRELQLAVPPQGETVIRSSPSVMWVAYFGAGIYEELLFRLLLIPPLAACLIHCGETRFSSWNSAALASSLLFAAAHYQTFAGTGEPLIWSTFLFRLLAGIFFATIFCYRGFGVSVGVHVLYDLLAGFIARF